MAFPQSDQPEEQADQVVVQEDQSEQLASQANHVLEPEDQSEQPDHILTQLDKESQKQTRILDQQAAQPVEQADQAVEPDGQSQLLEQARLLSKRASYTTTYQAEQGRPKLRRLRNFYEQLDAVEAAQTLQAELEAAQILQEQASFVSV